MEIVLGLLFLVCTCFSGESWPKPMQIINTSFDNSPFKSLFATQVARHADKIKEVLDLIHNEYLTAADVADFEAYVNNTYISDLAIEFVRAVPYSKYTDFLLYNSFFEVATNSMVAMMSGDSPSGTYMGYSQTVIENITFSRQVYDYLQELTFAVNYLDSEYSAMAVTFAGSIGYTTVRSDYAEAMISKVYDNDGQRPFPTIESNSYFSTVVTELAKKLADGYVLPSQLFQSFIYDIYAGKGLPTPSASDYFIKSGSINYPYSYLLAFANFGEYMGQIHTTDGADYTRSLTEATDDGWRIVQSSKRYNLEKPMRSDFSMIQVERSLDANVKDARTLDAFSNILRSYPFRQTTTVYLTTFSSNASNATLQKCTSITDATKTIVSCADPAPPTNWASVLGSIALIAIVIVGWVFGILNAKKYDKGLYQNARDAKGKKTEEKKKNPEFPSSA